MNDAEILGNPKFLEFLQISNEIHDEITLKHKERLPIILKIVFPIVKKELELHNFFLEDDVLLYDLYDCIHTTTIFTSVININDSSYSIVEKIRNYITNKYSEYIILHLKLNLNVQQCLDLKDHMTNIILKPKDSLFLNELENSLKDIHESYSKHFEIYKERQEKFEEESKAFLKSVGCY